MRLFGFRLSIHTFQSKAFDDVKVIQFGWLKKSRIDRFFKWKEIPDWLNKLTLNPFLFSLNNKVTLSISFLLSKFTF